MAKLPTLTSITNNSGVTAAPLSNGYVINNGSSGNAWASSSLSHSHTFQPDSTLTVNGDIIFKGTNLEQRLLAIEEFIGMPVRDRELERKHPQLKAAYDQYVTALRNAIPELKQLQEEYNEQLEKYQNWESLKK